MDKLHAVEDLEVFKKAWSSRRRIGSSLDVHRHSLNFPPLEQYALGDQIRRASKSICANLAEGLWSPDGVATGGVQTLRHHGHGLGRRDADLVPLLSGPRLPG